MATQAMLLGAAASCAVAAVGAAWGDRRRVQRRDPDAVGLLDWRTVQIVAIAGGLVSAALAIRG
jgi:hypothetical protein